MLDRSQPPHPAPVRELRFPAFERSSLANGLTLLTARSSALPLITFRLVVNAGGEHDTPESAGLAYLATRALEAGTRSRTADRIAWEFELLGGQLDIDLFWDYAAIAVTVPSDRAEPALALLAEIVTRPAFALDEIERLKREQLAELQQRRKEPRALASDMAARFIFADSVPYAYPLEGLPATVSRLSRDDVVAFHARTFAPVAAALVAIGNVDSGVQELAQRHFAEWNGSNSAAANFFVRARADGRRILLVHRPDSVQSELRVGHIGLPRKHPDYFALAAANSILGGAFTSRLNMSLREKHGFTYGVRSAFAFRKKPGPFLIQTAVATDVTVRALSEIVAETRLLLEHGAREEEAQNTRDYLAGIIGLELQTTEQISLRAGELFVHDLPNDYLSQHRATLMSVSLAEINSAARAHIHAEEFAITVVGDARQIETELATAGLGSLEIEES